jgi:hypothetical protein
MRVLTKGKTGADGEACTACAPGSAKAANGSRACGLCEEGKYSTVSGASSCFSCPQGSLSPVGSSSLNACADCKPGFEKNVSLADSIACRACIPGKYKATNGTSACVDCPHGHFSSESGAVGCSACPSASYSPQSGASNSDVCITCSGNSFSFPGSVYPDDCALGSDVLGLYTSDECGSLDQLATAAVLFRMEHGLEGVSDKVFLFFSWRPPHSSRALCASPYPLTPALDIDTVRSLHLNLHHAFLHLAHNDALSLLHSLRVGL